MNSLEAILFSPFFILDLFPLNFCQKASRTIDLEGHHDVLEHYLEPHTTGKVTIASNIYYMWS
jgi:hypothetical protein